MVKDSFFLSSSLSSTRSVLCKFPDTENKYDKLCELVTDSRLSGYKNKPRPGKARVEGKEVKGEEDRFLLSSILSTHYAGKEFLPLGN